MYLFCFLCLILLLTEKDAWALADIVVAVRSLRIAPYEEALRGFSAACGCTVRDVVISEQPGADMAALVRSMKPRLIAAVGMEALLSMEKITDVPIVYMMVLNPESYLTMGKNLTGVSLNIPPARQLSWLKKALPSVHRVGFLYNPLKSAQMVPGARQAAQELGLELVTWEVLDPREVPPSLEGMKDLLDVLWMVPDTVVVTPETVEAMLLFSLENRVPILAFSAKYVELGALMSVDLDVRDCGAQAGEMAARVLNGAPVSDIPRAGPRKAFLTVNLKTAKKMGITLGDAILHEARVFGSP